MAEVIQRYAKNPILTPDMISAANAFSNSSLVPFPEKINGLYARLDRPFESGSRGNIWLSYSPDLIHWGQHECIMESRSFAWDQGKIGPGAPPIKTKDGWLVLYHGVTPRINA